MMKNIVGFLIILSTLCISNCIAQNVHISDCKIVKHDSLVILNFSVQLDKLSANERLVLSPVLYDSLECKYLDSIVVVGYIRRIADKRLGNTEGIKTEKLQYLFYTDTFPYQHWMRKISLCIDRNLSSCCSDSIYPFLDVFKDRLLDSSSFPTPMDSKKPLLSYKQETVRSGIPPPPIASMQVAKVEPKRQSPQLKKTPKVEILLPIPPFIASLTPEVSATVKLDGNTSFLQATKEYLDILENLKNARIHEALSVSFRQGYSTVEMNLKNNAQSLSELRRVLEVIKSDPQAVLSKIIVAGSTSPEGSMAQNINFSKKRAESMQYYINVLRQYIGDTLKVSENQFELLSLNENWSEFRRIVEASNMEFKDLVLQVIDKEISPDAKKTELKKIENGRPYAYMLENFFPQLRAAYIQIFYDIHPSPDFIAVNKAIQLYNEGEYAEALQILEGTKISAKTENIKGSCHMMLGDYKQAETSLQTSINMGDAQAVETMEQILKLKSNKNK